MNKPSLVIGVVEDSNHRMLLYRYLRRRGILAHQIRFEPSPSGRGSAENWVRNQFVKEIKAYRSRHAATCLVVMVDADTRSVNERLMQLDQALREKGMQPVGNGERIARLVPKRNVETWILCLNGREVDEETDYKDRNDWSQPIAQAGQSLAEWSGPNMHLPNHCVESLRLGIRELGHLML